MMLYTVYKKAPPCLILLLLMMLTSCARSPGYQQNTSEDFPAPENKTAWNQYFSEKSYIKAWGVSTRNAQMAGQNAQAAVAAAVRSSIESELVSVMKSESIQGEVRDYQKLESITKTRTHFKHAELIKLVPQTTHKKNGEYWVMAVLSRREAADELMIPYLEYAVPFRLQAGRLEALNNDCPAFTKTWKKVQAHYRKLKPAAAEVRAVAGGPFPEMVNDENLFHQAELSRQNLLHELKVNIQVEEQPELNQAELVRVISEAIMDLGLSVSGGFCQDGFVSLKISPDLKWKNIMGQIVELQLLGDVGICGEEDSWTGFTIKDRRMRGEGRRPLVDLGKRIESDYLSDYFYNILDQYLPLGD